MGDVAIRTDISTTFILEGDNPSVLANWREILTPFTGIASVTGSAPIVSSGGNNPVISLANLGVATGHIANKAVTQDKLADAVWDQITSASGAMKHSQTIGNGSATQFTVTHNLGTRDVIVLVYEAGSPWAEVIADVEHATTNAVTVRFSEAPASNEFRVVVVA
jgi:hypothetical protein